MLTDEQRILRLGSIGGSGITNAVSKGKGRADYLYRKASEIVTGVPAPSKTFQYADRGNELEDAALSLFAYRYDLELKKVKIRRKTRHKHYTPDALVIGQDSFCEVKVRLPHVFMANVDSGAIETSTRRQMQWGFRILGRKLCYYIQYCPEMPDPLYVQEIRPDLDEIAWLDKKADEFISEMLEIVDRYQ